MLTAKRLREVLRYDYLTGNFYWIIASSPRREAGMLAGSQHKTLGYIAIGIDGKKYFAHRLAWLYMTGKWPSKRLDHRDCNRSNNKWPNLRQATGSQNISNAKLHKDSRSGFKGVTWSKYHRRWHANIRSNGVRYYLGHYATAIEAHTAYCEATHRLNGEFARTS